MNNWNFFEYIGINTYNGSKEIEEFKEHMKIVGIKNYKIKIGKNFNKKNIGDKDNTFQEIYNYDKSCCGEVCRELSKCNIDFIKDAYSKGCNNIFIFEDDARFDLPFNFKKLNRIVEWLKKNKDWEAFYFGYILHPNPLLIPISLDIGKLFDPLCAHAIVIHRRGMEKILDYVNRNGYPDNHIDKFYKNLLNHKYGSLPVMNYQCNNPALYKKWLDKLPKNIGIQNMNYTSFTKIENSWWIVILVLGCIIGFLIIFLIIYYNWSKKRKNRRK